MKYSSQQQNWLLKTMTQYEWKVFQIMKIILLLKKKQILQIKPNFHGVEKYVISLEYHLNPKTNNNNQFFITIIEKWNSFILHFSQHGLFIK
jgi:hypothetical protein